MVIFCGIDEVGRGSLVGPIVLALVVSNGIFVDGVKDSKKLTITQMTKLFPILTKLHQYRVTVINKNFIDDTNIGYVNKFGVVQLVRYLKVNNFIALCDGNMDFCDNRIISVKSGDSLYYSIAASSIIAKVIRNRILKRLSLFYNKYFWDMNDGYPTRQHVDCIKEFGYTKFHRRSFKVKGI